MIRQLQNAGPTVKIILGAMLVIICASMAITLIPGGIGSSLGLARLRRAFWPPLATRP
jgi:hypothetical protein